jgi:protein-disulfide isomerase
MTSRAQIDRKQMQTRAAERATEQHQGRLQPPVGPHDHAQGTEHARVTLVEYGDYQCPYCGMAYPIVKALQEQFGTELRFVFRNFPLSELHPHALHAALAAESVAATEGDAAFWALHDAIFEHQQDSETALDDRSLASYASDVGADAARVARDLASAALEQRIRSDFLSGVRSGVNGTPTFFIDGERYDGDWTSVDAFSVALREAASQTSARREPRIG